MTTTSDGGPAFPKNGNMAEPIQTGMTLRDYFAAKAMAAMLVDESVRGGASALTVAKAAYNMADAMLAAREAKCPASPS